MKYEYLLKKCPHCGAARTGEGKFCQYCGGSLVIDSDAVASAAIEAEADVEQAKIAADVYKEKIQSDERIAAHKRHSMEKTQRWSVKIVLFILFGIPALAVASMVVVGLIGRSFILNSSDTKERQKILDNAVSVCLEIYDEDIAPTQDPAVISDIFKAKYDDYAVSKDGSSATVTIPVDEEKMELTVMRSGDSCYISAVILGFDGSFLNLDKSYSTTRYRVTVTGNKPPTISVYSKVNYHTP